MSNEVRSNGRQFNLHPSVVIPSHVPLDILDDESLEQLQNMPAEEQTVVLMKFSNRMRRDRRRDPKRVRDHFIKCSRQRSDSSVASSSSSLTPSPSLKTNSNENGNNGKYDVAVPEVVFRGKASELFRDLSEKRQAEAIMYCKQVARSLIGMGETISNPSAFYSSRFLAFLDKQHSDDENSSSVFNQKLIVTPKVEMLPPMSDRFDSLPPDQQKEAREYCENAARTILLQNKTIRNHRAFYSKVFSNFVPMFEIQNEKLLRRFAALPEDRQTAARAQCIATARMVMHKGDIIRNRIAFYERMLERYISTPYNNASRNTNKNTTEKNTNDETAKDSTSSTSTTMDTSNSDSITVPTSVIPTRTTSNESHSTTTADHTTVAMDLLRQELSDTQSKLSVKTTECQEYELTCNQLNEQLQQKIDAEDQLKQQLQRALEENELLRNALNAKKQNENESNKSDQKMMRDMTSTLTKISQELCKERDSRRDTEVIVKEQSDHIKEQECKIQQLFNDKLNAEKHLESLQYELEETKSKLFNIEKRTESFQSSIGTTSSIRSSPSRLLSHTGLTTYDAFIMNGMNTASLPFHHFNYDNFPTSFDIDGAECEDRIQAEIRFLSQTYSMDELQTEHDRITRRLRLQGNNETLFVDFMLIVNLGYPFIAPLSIEATLAPDTTDTSSQQLRKLAIDALPSLIEVCQHQANSSLGQEAMSAVLHAADRWIQHDWVHIILTSGCGLHE